MKKFLLAASLLLTLTACTSPNAGGSSFPVKNIEFVAPASPGGGWDTTARAMQKTLDDEGIVKKPINIVNKPGGSGEVGWKYLKNKDAHTLAVNSSLLITNNLLGQSDLTYDDFTPIAILATEWEAVVVPKDSDIEKAEDLMTKLKKDPKSLKLGVAPGLGNDDHLSFVQAAKTYGVEVPKLDFLVYESGGDVATALLGNHIDAATMSVSEAKEQYKAGKVKILAVSSKERLEGLEKVPTWKEEGVDMSFPHWRGIMGPPDMSEEEIAFWDEKISEMVKTEAWKEILQNNEWEAYYKNSSETKKFLQEQNEMYKDLLNDSGLTE
ncbi:tripartite tricarboxylate transporter substrate binding protein [Paludifilum halophilum]|uniref:Transporter n=1 Tax=Paludifilum halophilum TaxID=1642702 RepID=A0A235B652_9BACL|nr:tripartite tricarboxylate transporter substrate binding protein [Paludifilum halophilum]OYD07773.1 hypothetical protein CHM34_09910 [Paludifilum halophilum]